MAANLRIPIDSFLRKFALFEEVEDILDKYDQANPEEEEASVDEVTARACFYKFVELAILLDTYQNWDDTQWTNFLMYMLQAYQNKGNVVAVNCALAAIGVQVTEPVTYENIYFNNDTGEEWEDSLVVPDLTQYTLKSVVTIVIDVLQTPNVSSFFDKLAELIPELLWLHELDLSRSYVKLVHVTVALDETYYRTFYSTGIRYARIESIGEVTDVDTPDIDVGG